MRRIKTITMTTIYCIICIGVVATLGLLIITEGPLLIWQSETELTFPAQEGAAIVQIVADQSASFTPFYLSITTDEWNHRVYSICCYNSLHFEDKYLVKRIDISMNTIVKSWYWGTTRSFKELFPNFVVANDPDFYENLLSVVSSDENSSISWIYCDGFVFTSKDGENYLLEHEVRKTTAD